jgi:hypothetical protein
MNPFGSVLWLWRAVRGHSVTFAALFASAVLGFALDAMIRRILFAAYVPLFTAFLIPAVIIAILAKKETRWMPDPVLRRRIALGLVVGSLLVAGLGRTLGW